MRSNLPTDRIIALVEELSELQLWGDSMNAAVSKELLLDLPPKPPLIQYEIEQIRLATDYRKRTVTARERQRLLRTKLPLNDVQVRARDAIVSTATDLNIPLDAIVDAIKKAQEEASEPLVNKAQIDL